MNFPGGSICSTKRHVFSRRFYLFVKQTLLSHRTDINFSRNPYLVLKHIQIFQEPLFSHQTDPHFPGFPGFHFPYLVLQTHTFFQKPPMPRTHRHFPGRYPEVYPLSNRYFANRSRWLLSYRVDREEKTSLSCTLYFFLAFGPNLRTYNDNNI